MRVALLQVAWDTKIRAANVQSLLRIVDRAAEGAPPPDLLALPCACDTGGAQLRRATTDAMLECVRSALAAKAREWGVYIAAGLHDRREGPPEHRAVLFDPDGDIVARSPELRRGAGARDPRLPAIWPTAVGCIGVTCSTLNAPEGVLPGAEGGGILFVWPRLPGATTLDKRKATTELKALRSRAERRRGAYWAAPRAEDPAPP